MDRVDGIVIGAGAVGLAVACELSRLGSDILVVERNGSFGQETSSRNSEVIHAGIYYPKGSLKHTTCIEGGALLYEFCERHNIPYRRSGKLIIASGETETAALEALYARGRENGVAGLELLSRAALEALEPAVVADAAIHSPVTGILDTHAYMKCLVGMIAQNAGQIAYAAECTGIEKSGNGYTVTVRESGGGLFSLESAAVINCAGLSSDKVASLAGIRTKDYALAYCKGDYFRLNPSCKAPVSRLVYPVPREKQAGLGIHLTPDLAGSIRLGPDDEYVQEIDYRVDPRKARLFAESVGVFLPGITARDITPDTSGIRPKLQGPGEGFRDFVICHEEARGYPGLVNLIGIESPGLTASLAIARLVSGMVKEIL